MASGDDLRIRMWRDRLVRALAVHLPAELDVAEEIAGMVLVHGLPPGLDEMAVLATLRASQGATEGWVERVMEVVRAVRDGIRLMEPELEPMRGGQPTLEVGRAPGTTSGTTSGTASGTTLSMPSGAASGTTSGSVQGSDPASVPSPAPVSGAAPALPAPEIVLTLVLERLRALDEVQRLAPQVEGTRHSLRTLRLAVGGEADESARLPLLLAEWLATRQRWEAHNQVFLGALATLRSSEWLLQYLRAPGPDQE